jgi:putative transposase
MPGKPTPKVVAEGSLAPVASTYIDLGIHIVFATKGRQPWILGENKDHLHAYLGGIAHSLNVVPIAIGGVEDHVHLLLGLRATHAPADIVRELKKASNPWLRDQLGRREFAWQEGYAALSVSAGDRTPLIAYIKNQEAHHRKQSSADELRGLLKAAGIEIDERYWE